MKGLNRISKMSLALLVTLLVATLLTTMTAFAQTETAEVIVVSSIGGTTTPAAGTYTYNYGDTIELTATALEGFKFQYWVIQGIYTPGHNVPPINFPENAEIDPEWVPDFPSPSTLAMDSLIMSTNPLKIICGYGYTYMYQPVFTPIATPAPGNNSVVIILSGLGGTTDPAPGTYTYLADQTVTLKATADSGFDFQYWIAKGAVAGHDT